MIALVYRRSFPSLQHTYRPYHTHTYLVVGLEDHNYDDSHDGQQQ